MGLGVGVGVRVRVRVGVGVRVRVRVGVRVRLGSGLGLGLGLGLRGDYYGTTILYYDYYTKRTGYGRSVVDDPNPNQGLLHVPGMGGR